jgi:signal transduction histidine kinase
MTVADDEIGLDARESMSWTGANRGVGLFNTKQRLPHLGWSLKVCSKPRQGARIALLAPLKHHAIKRAKLHLIVII